MPTQKIVVAPDGTPRTMPRPLSYRDILNIPALPVVKTLQPEIVVNLDKLEEACILGATGSRRELLLIARNRAVRQLQKNIGELFNEDQTQTDLQKFRKIQETIKRIKAIDPTWKINLKF